MPELFLKGNRVVLKKFGFSFISQRGSHGKYKNNSGNIVVLPMNKKEIPYGTFKSILKQADITLKQFENNV